MITFFHCAWAWSWHNNIFLFKVAYLLCTLYTNQLSQSSQESHPSYETLVFSVDELVFNRCRWSSAQENIFLHKKSFCVIHKKTFYFFTPLFFCHKIAFWAGQITWRVYLSAKFLFWLIHWVYVLFVLSVKFYYKSEGERSDMMQSCTKPLSVTFDQSIQQLKHFTSLPATTTSGFLRGK